MTTKTATGRSTRSAAADAVREAVLEASTKLADRRASLGLLFVSPHLDFELVMQTARDSLPGVELVGCTSAGELTERGLTHDGLALMLISSDEIEFDALGASHVAADPSSAARTLSHGFEQARSRRDSAGLSFATSILLVDGINGRGESLVDDVLRATGTLHEVVGGAAGDEGEFVGTRVSGGGVSGTDAAVCVRAFSKHRWGIGVDHGLTPASAMMRVTRADGSVLYELDGRPAFEAYREFAATRGARLEPDDAGSFLIDNELGVYVFDQFQHARAALKVGADGSLSCAGAISQGASVCILGGSVDSLARAAGRAAEEARRRLGGRRAAGVLLFDCRCRGSILGDDFQRELDAVTRVFPDTPLAGLLTYGEIARYGGRLDGWHNATVVVVCLPA